MTLKQPCHHGRYDEHQVVEIDEPAAWLRSVETGIILDPACPGGTLLPPDSLVIVKEDGEWPDWALLGFRSALFRSPPKPGEPIGNHWARMLDALAAAQRSEG